MSHELIMKKKLPDTLVKELQEVKMHLHLLHKVYCKAYLT